MRNWAKRSRGTEPKPPQARRKGMEGKGVGAEKGNGRCFSQSFAAERRYCVAD